MESELFGHVKGSFSGAVENKKGLVELADGGTAFFDEIGDLPLEMQVKLLRLSQEREFRPVGALQWRKVDLRIIAATHRDLKAEVAAGRFRQDLFYRLQVVVVHLPALREHKEDIPLLMDRFLELGQAAGLPPFRPDRELVEALFAYDWPGNVRELKHAIDRMAAMHSEGVLQMCDMPSALQNHLAVSEFHRLSATSALHRLSGAAEKQPAETFDLPPRSPVFSIPQSEERAIREALAATGNERGRAARLLKIGRTTLYRKMKQYGLD
jgi:DNA-binding NtrC family response regulator